jgi:hypothetical protein
MHKRKRKFGKSREYCLIDGIAFHIWSFGRVGFPSAGKLRAGSICGSFSTGKGSIANICGHRRVCHSVLLKPLYKIVVDGIESHPFHLEIEDDWLLVHQANDPKCPSLRSFSPKSGIGKRL